MGSGLVKNPPTSDEFQVRFFVFHPPLMKVLFFVWTADRFEVQEMLLDLPEETCFAPVS